MLIALWVIAAMTAAIGVNLIGIHLLGSVSAWSRWLESHRWPFLAWRMCLYGGTAWVWWWMHRRVREREPERGARVRLWRAEIAAVLAVLVLEGSVLLR